MSSFSGGFMRDPRSVAANPGITVGRTVELTMTVERASGQSFQAGERFRAVRSEGGAWTLERPGVTLRKVSSFQIRLVEDE